MLSAFERKISFSTDDQCRSIYGRAVEKRWQISDAIDQVHEQIRELMPSFYADVRMPQPAVSPKLLITPIFHDFFRFFPVFPGTFGRAPWIPGVQTVKMGERWGKMGKKWVKNGITGLQKTALMHASAHLRHAVPVLVGGRVDHESQKWRH